MHGSCVLYARCTRRSSRYMYEYLLVGTSILHCRSYYLDLPVHVLDLVHVLVVSSLALVVQLYG